MRRQDGIAVLFQLIALLPLLAVHGLGVLIGWLLWLFPNEPRRIAATNLALCFPEYDELTRNRLLCRNLMESGKAVLELGPLWLWDGRRLLKLIRSVEGERAWQDALAMGRGAIAITPHLGAWEVSGLYVSSRYPITTLYRPSRLGIDALIRAGRERLGATTVPTDSRGVRALFQALRAGEVLGILPDQDPGSEGGVWAPFFGQPANTMVLLSRLAMKNGSPVFMLCAERLPWAQGYCLRFEPLPEVVWTGPLEASVAAVNTTVERAVRRKPEQYLWSYKRFKTRPPGEARLY
jgi:KDO2-lipid IV(A) lauroyltransferase